LLAKGDSLEQIKLYCDAAQKLYRIEYNIRNCKRNQTIVLQYEHKKLLTDIFEWFRNTGEVARALVRANSIYQKD